MSTRRLDSISGSWEWRGTGGEGEMERRVRTKVRKQGVIEQGRIKGCMRNEGMEIGKKIMSLPRRVFLERRGSVRIKGERNRVTKLMGSGEHANRYEGAMINLLHNRIGLQINGKNIYNPSYIFLFGHIYFSLFKASGTPS